MKAGKGEFDFINRLRQRIQNTTGQRPAAASSFILPPSSLQIGIGDDAAVFNQNSKLQTVISTDMLVEDVDFRRRWLTIKQLARCLGHKALAVSLSDIAAMGARPRFCLTSIGLPQDIWRTNFADEFYTSLLALAHETGVTLIGGDTSRTPAHIVIDSIVVGEVEKGRAVRRSGAQVGDRIFVTGRLGGAAAGLRLLETASRKTKFDDSSTGDTTRRELLRRQLRPTPRLAWGAFLGAQRIASAMLDISDGLASDIRHVCDASNVGATIDAARVPVGEGDDLRLALSGGEDYELLFTVPPTKLKHLPPELDGVSATEVGVITQPPSGVRIVVPGRARPLTARGFRHF